MKFFQQQVRLPSHRQGFHLITDAIEAGLPDVRELSIGMLHVFIRHTSASLTINEDADPTVRKDFESYFNAMVPEAAPYYEHDVEGPDDMPAHLKASILGSSITIPISDGKLQLGAWQGVYLCEHRNRATAREIVLTAWGI